MSYMYNVHVHVRNLQATKDFFSTSTTKGWVVTPPIDLASGFKMSCLVGLITRPNIAIGSALVSE